MDYYFNNLDPITFQRLVNGILVARYGEDIRLTPLRGSDGGRDGEIEPSNAYFELTIGDTTRSRGSFMQPRPGRYFFQVKHHNTTDTNTTEARRRVISEFEKEEGVSQPGIATFLTASSLSS